MSDNFLVGCHRKDRLLVGYDQDRWSHERLLIRSLNDAKTIWVIATPHGDLYVENADDWSYCGKVGVRGGYPPGWGLTRTSRVVAFDQQVIDDNFDDWVARAESETYIDTPSGTTSAKLPTGSDPIDWVALEARHGYKVGEPVLAEAGVLVAASDRGLLTLPAGVLAVAKLDTLVDTPAAASGKAGGLDDLRTLTVLYDSDGVRGRTFETSLSGLTETSFDDWPVAGPRTTKWLCKNHGQSSTTFRRRHQRWKSTLAVTSSNEGVEDHSTLAEVFEVALSYDQLNISELASFELLSRRFQLWEQTYAEKLRTACQPSSSSTLEVDERSLFMGRAKSGLALVSPALQSYIADNLRDSSAILKERRKAKEEKDHATGGASSGGGGGKNNKNNRRNDKNGKEAPAGDGK